MSFTKNSRRGFDPSRRPFSLPSFAGSPIARYFVYAAFAIGAAAYGLIRHYTRTMPPMLVPAAPAPSTAPTFDVDAGEMPVPEEWLYEGDAR